MTGRHHFGQFLTINRIVARMEFWSPSFAEIWIENLMKFSGAIEWTWLKKASKLEFTLEGLPLQRLEMNASNRRNCLPVYGWDDSDHPLTQD